MTSIITYLVLYNQYLLKTISELILFIAKFIPLKQLAFEDSNSPSYQKFKLDILPIIKKFEKQDFNFLLEYCFYKYGKPIKPVQRRNGRTIPEDTICPLCDAPHLYIYDNNGGKGQFQCKVCGQTFITGERVVSPITLICPYCQHVLSPKKNRKHFIVHKCINEKCSYYKANLKLLPKDKYKYKLHYIYREFTLDFFSMDLNQLPSWVASFNFRKNNAHIMGLCLTYHVNLGLSLRKTAEAMQEIHNISISHTMVDSYARTVAVLIKPFTNGF